LNPPGRQLDAIRLRERFLKWSVCHHNVARLGSLCTVIRANSP